MSFTSPIGTRYKAPVLSKIWSQNSKIKHMRQLWIDLATFQKQLGVEQITDEGIEEMKANIENINIERIPPINIPSMYIDPLSISDLYL